jgi:hypothetical protein
MHVSTSYTPQRKHQDQYRQGNETLQEETDEHHATNAADPSGISFSAKSNTANNKKRMTPATPVNNGANTAANGNTLVGNDQGSNSTDSQQLNPRRIIIGHLSNRNQTSTDHQRPQRQQESPVNSILSPEVASNDLGKRAKLSQSPKLNSNTEAKPLMNNTTNTRDGEIIGTPLSARNLLAELQNESTKAPPYESPPPGGGGRSSSPETNRVSR